MDEILIEGIAERLRRSDPVAVECLVAAFYRPVFRYLLCRGLDSALAEELTADTFFQLVRSSPNFRGDDHQVRAFVYATARNVRSSHHRRARRVDVSCEGIDDVIEFRASPLQTLLAEEQGEELAVAMDQLSEVAREIVLLRFVEDLSIKEISAACDLPVGTVKSHLHRAKQELKRMLTQIENQQ